jgi:3-dehydroquinate synthetase
MTLIDPETLRTLPLRHWRNGFAEMLKYGAALQIGLWRRLQTMIGGKELHRPAQGARRPRPLDAADSPLRVAQGAGCLRGRA